MHSFLNVNIHREEVAFFREWTLIFDILCAWVDIFKNYEYYYHYEEKYIKEKTQQQ